jgi:KUP system potassium uptake protein
MTTWKRGRELLREIMNRGGMPIDLFLDDIQRRKPPRVPGTAVFMTSSSEGAPVVLLHHLKHNKVLHEKVILMSIGTVEVPEVEDDDRVSVEELGEGFYRVTARYGFMETPDVRQIARHLTAAGIRTKPQETSYYLGRERLLATGKARMSRWRKKVFIFMARNARSASEFFGIPPNRAVELGAQIEF